MPTFEVTATSVFNRFDSAPFELNRATTVEQAVIEVCKFFEEEGIQPTVEFLNKDFTVEGKKACITGLNETSECVCIVIDLWEV